MIRDTLPAADTPEGFVVRDPQAGDALAGSLHAAYRRETAVPDDFIAMLAMLTRIDHATQGRRHR